MAVSQRRLPAEIYWRRRLLVLAIVIALVWVGLRLLGGGDGDEDKTAPKATAAPTASATPTAPVKVNGIVDVSLVSDSTPCDVEKIRVTPTVRPGQLTRGTV